MSEMRPEKIQQLLEKGTVGGEFELYDERAVSRSIDIQGNLGYPGIDGRARHAVLVDIGEEVREEVNDTFLQNLLEQEKSDLATWKVYSWQYEEGRKDRYKVDSGLHQTAVSDSLSEEVERFGYKNSISILSESREEYVWREEDVPIGLNADYSSAYIWNNRVKDGERDILS